MKIRGHAIKEWVRVGEYEVIVHKATGRVHGQGQNKARVISIEIEYRNETNEKDLSCRQNQWILYDENGYKYNAQSGSLAVHLYHDKHYFGNTCTLKPGMNVRGWLVFTLPENAKTQALQFITAFLNTQTAEFDIEDSIESEKALEDIQPMPNQYHLIEKEYGKLNQAAGDFLLNLPDDNIKQAISLSAEMAGLKLLRAAQIDLSRHEPGNVVMGAILDGTYDQIRRFMFSWANSNGLMPVFGGAELSPEDKRYLPEVAQLEDPFDAICREKELIPEHDPFAAITACLKLVLAGKKLGLIDEKTGQVMTLYHILLGSKIVPSHPLQPGD